MFIVNWFKLLYHRYKMRKQLEKLRKDDPFVY